MTELTPEGRKELRYLAEYMKACGEAWEPDACLIGNMKAAKVALIGTAVPLLLDALEASERGTKALIEQHDMWKGSWEVCRADNARLQSENAALRQRVEGLERVREAAELFVTANDHGQHGGETKLSERERVVNAAFDALRAALSACPPKGGE